MAYFGIPIHVMTKSCHFVHTSQKTNTKKKLKIYLIGTLSYYVTECEHKIIFLILLEHEHKIISLITFIQNLHHFIIWECRNRVVHKPCLSKSFTQAQNTEIKLKLFVKKERQCILKTNSDKFNFRTHPATNTQILHNHNRSSIITVSREKLQSFSPVFLRYTAL